ncbi:MAG: M23 family metallopeptidase [Gammaproteobacteria bacterium]
MEIVLISKSNGALARLHIRWYAFVTAFGAFGLVAAAVFFTGFEHGGDKMANRLLNDVEYATNFWQSEIASNRKFLSQLRTDFDADLSALSSKMGSLQAHIVRLDALAQRVVDVAQLDSEEFALSESPAIGGPSDKASITPKWSNLLENLQSLNEEIEFREERLDALNALLNDRHLKESMYPGGDPVVEGWISSRFGYRTDPVSGSREFHGGIDFAGREGADVTAVGGGIITWSGRRWGYGNLVEISHGNGYVTRYAHNKKNLVKIGEKVSKDQTIALLGSTGRSTGPHVHFEVLKDGKVVNPRKFIEKNTVH